jgi:6-pyruvoyltetrahydropterin/6-carboxytetrahydropterin synthase
VAASLSRVVGFQARHRFFRPDWSEARNREAFGPLSDAPGHAHDYQCVVTVSGPLEASRGMVMDLGVLDRILRE